MEGPVATYFPPDEFPSPQTMSQDLYFLPLSCFGGVFCPNKKKSKLLLCDIKKCQFTPDREDSERLKKGLHPSIDSQLVSVLGFLTRV